MVEGALEGARKDNARLQNEFSTLRASVRRGIAVEDTPTAPAEPDEPTALPTAMPAEPAAASAQKA